MKPRIVILSAFLSPFRSGAEACAEEVPRLLKERYDFTIVTARLDRSLPRADDLNGIPIVCVGLGLPIDKWLFPFLAPFVVRKLKPNIVHAILESYAGLALVLCKYFCPSARPLLTQQSTNTSFLLSLMYRSGTALTAISRALVARSQAHGRGDVRLIPNGVPFQLIRRICEQTERMPGRVLFVGRLERMKGVDVLLAAFAEVVSGQRAAVSAHLRVVGDGSQKENLQRLAQDLGIANRVTFVGRIPSDEVCREYAQAEIFAGLSRSEALGNVFLEAQAAGCAVVTTRIGGIVDVIADGSTGLLVPPDNPGAAAAAIERLLASPEERARLAAAGIEHAKNFNWNIIAEKYAEAYQDLLKE